jgi:putative ubiquitin-RnfH superfamily antitoxin RatB of RatAB toxin-antitoxin module
MVEEVEKASEKLMADLSKIPNIKVELVYARPEKQFLRQMKVKQGTSAMAAVMNSGLTTEYPDIDLANSRMGIFSRLLDGKQLPLPEHYELQEGDRVEVYRPLLIDPKQARAERAQRARQVREGARHNKKNIKS